MAPDIPDPYAYVLDQMARGVRLKTSTIYGVTTAWLGSHEIPAEIVATLKAQGKIKFGSEAWNHGRQHGYHRWYVLA